MFKAHLFLGLPIDRDLEEQLKKQDPQLLSFFIQPGENYLQKASLESLEYLGKYIDKETDVAALELLELNIYSLLQRLVPAYSFGKQTLNLFSVVERNEPNSF